MFLPAAVQGGCIGGKRIWGIFQDEQSIEFWVHNLVYDNSLKNFREIYQQGTFDVMKIWDDTEIGVNYVFHRNGNATGFTLLLDKEGKPEVMLP